ncbi:SDR family oxidoreductase [Geminicoccaceae bacterium 1502E]|nr:SDR family oxidoreductase [Geminicoccaceae bacterium 1502E]
MSGATEVLVVTGGSRGIGAAIVRHAARQGYAVCFSYLRESKAAGALVEEVAARGGRARCFQGDVADPGFAEAAFEEAAAAFGPVTALVNNAGVTGPIGRFSDVSRETLRHTLDTNLLGTMLLAREAVRRWETAGLRGRIVNISSVAATLGAPGEYVHYAATKAAVEALTIGLGKEVAASGIRVNAVAPGTAWTDIHAAAGEPDRPARVVARVPMGRIGEPDEMAAAVLWLLSKEASYVTGTVLRVSGGV